MAVDTNRDWERVFVGDRQISMTHFFAVRWFEDSEQPYRFAFGYWTHDAVFCQGFVDLDRNLNFGLPVFNTTKREG